MEIFRKSGVAGTFTVPLIDTSKRPSYKNNPTIEAGDVKVIRYTSGDWDVSNIDSIPGVIAGATANVLVDLTSDELTSDDLSYPIIVQFVDQTPVKEWDDQTVIIWTKDIDVDLAKIDGNSVNDNTAVLKLKQLNLSNETDDAVYIYSKNKDAIKAESVYGSALNLKSHVWYGSKILTSADGEVWADSGIDVKPRFSSIAYNGTSLYVGVCLGGEIFSSSDGIEWINQNIFNSQQLNHVIWDGTQFVAVGNGGCIFSSSDGVTWTSVSINPYDILSIIFNGSVYLLLCMSDTILSNTDLNPSTWVPNYLPPSPWGAYTVLEAAWDGTQFVAVNNTSGIFTSPDGLVWTAVEGPYRTYSSIVWDNDNEQFVVVGPSATILTSPDGSVWTERISGLINYENLWSIAWNGSLYTVVGEWGTILTSDDGVDWTVQTSETDFYLLYVIWDGTSFMAVGSIARPSSSVSKPTLSVSSENLNPSPAVYIKGDMAGVKIDANTNGIEIMDCLTGIFISVSNTAIQLVGGSKALILSSNDVGVDISGTNIGMNLSSQSGNGMHIAGGGGSPALKLEGDSYSGGAGLEIKGHINSPAVLISAGENSPGILINGGTISGNGVDIVSTQGHGINVTPNSDMDAIHLEGGLVGIYAKGTNHGIHATSMDAPASGAGLLVEGGGGPGFEAVGDEDQPGILARSVGGTGHGVVFRGINGGNGLVIEAGANAYAMQVTGGINVIAGSDKPGLNILGSTTEPGIAIKGGITGHGIKIDGGETSGNGINISTTDGEGINIAATGVDRNGILVTAPSDASSSGVNIQGGCGLFVKSLDYSTYGIQSVGGMSLSSHPDMPGLTVIGAFSAPGVNIVGGTTGNGIDISGWVDGYDINAREVKTLVHLDSTIDSVPVSDVLELVMAMVNGRFVKDEPEPGHITFYKRNGSDVLFEVVVTETERDRI